MTLDPLMDEAMRRSGVVWVSVPGRAPRVVWHVWHDSADHVLHGGGEQDVPGLAEAATAEVTVRVKSTGANIGTWSALVSVVEPGSDDWAALEPLLRKARWHAEPDPTERWRTGSTLTRLTPR